MGVVKDLVGGVFGGLLGGKQRMPAPPPIARAAPPAPQPTDPAVLAARDAIRRKAAAASYPQTVATTSTGLTTPATTTPKTVLGT